MSAFIPDQLDEMSRKELVKAAKIMHEHNVKLMALITGAKERVKKFESIVADSEGVTGYHLNGDIATWDELLD